MLIEGSPSNLIEVTIMASSYLSSVQLDDMFQTLAFLRKQCPQIVGGRSWGLCRNMIGKVSFAEQSATSILLIPIEDMQGRADKILPDYDEEDILVMWGEDYYTHEVDFELITCFEVTEKGYKPEIHMDRDLASG